MAPTRAARSPIWKFMKASWFWMPWTALVNCWSVSAGMAYSWGGGGGGDDRGRVVVGTSAPEEAMGCDTPMVGVTRGAEGLEIGGIDGDGEAVVGGTAGDEVPDEAIKSDTRLLGVKLLRL